MQRVLREVHLWSKLRHQNVVPLLGFVTQFDLTISIVSEWMHKGNAFEYVQNTDVDPRPLLQGIANGLNYLHSRDPNPVYHGDLKGPNVLISNDGHALLTDFGLSYIVNSSCTFQVAEPRGGTLNWIAPENLDDYKISPEGDIWAFGMTALELFTRRRPFNEAQSLAALLVRILKGPPDRPTDESTYSRLTDEWWDLCVSCWKREPLRRPKIAYLVQKTDQMMAGVRL
ncbi:kinase-like domain-containing protein [Scleroderma yunnanense]